LFWQSRFVPPRDRPSSPTRRSSDLSGLIPIELSALSACHNVKNSWPAPSLGQLGCLVVEPEIAGDFVGGDQSGEHAGRGQRVEQDRKSTRLNSSHVKISYAVICLKR